MSGHTPEEWEADIRLGCFAIWPKGTTPNCLSRASSTAIVYQDGRGEESYPGAYRYLTPEQMKRAQVLAAAPELLEACKVVVAFLDRLEYGDESLLRIRQRVHAPLRAALEPAIAKAEGRS